MGKEGPEKVREKKNIEGGMWGAGVTGCMMELRTEPTRQAGAHRQLPSFSPPWLSRDHGSGLEGTISSLPHGPLIALLSSGLPFL